MAIVWIILVELLCIQLVSGVCQQSGKSGPGCVYNCHCSDSNNCDVSSNCQGQCTSGWRGSTCQQENFALKKTTHSSPLETTQTTPGKAVDGNLGNRDYSQFHTDGTSPAWWSVDLGSQISVQDVIIYFRIDNTFRRNGIELYRSTSMPNIQFFNSWGTHCYTVSGLPNGTDIPNDLTITQCSGQWRYLFIYTVTMNDPNGPILDFAEVEVYGCSKGTYGNDCSQFCDGCNINGCDKFGQCISGCRPGRTPPTLCNQNCTEGYYGNNCAARCDRRGCNQLPAQCDSVTGYCPGGCTDYFSNADCSVCAGGWYGYYCNTQCASRECASSTVTSSCDRYTWYCPAGCKAGYQDNDCRRPCNNGTYGLNCQKLCSSRKCQLSQAPCDSVYGNCNDNCIPGYGEIDCSVCSSNNYGESCTKPCSSRHCLGPAATCDSVTGRCPGGCQDGWTGTDCVTACSSGSYGAGCRGSCSSRQCLTSSDPCHHVTGNCTSGCKPGKMGTDCTQNCTSGSYGINCMKFCSARKCEIVSPTCDIVNGQCSGSCQIGYSGADCSTPCSTGTYGRECLNCSSRHCSGDQTCPSDGRCSQGCASGWILDTCTQACSSGFYGDGCNSSCGNCSNNDICNHITGNCSQGCHPGKMPGLCKSPCARGMHGDNCKLTCGNCNGTCNPVSGQCPGGCMDGYTGDKCSVLPQKGVPPPDYVPAVAGAVAGILVVAIVVIAIIVYRRRRGGDRREIPKDTSNSPLQVFTGSTGELTKQTNDNMYANVAKKVNEKTKIKPDIPEKPTLIMPTAKPQSKSPLDPEEEIIDEDEPTSKRDYYNLDDTAVIREIPIGELSATILKIKSQEGGFEAEYSRLPNGFTAPYGESQKPENAGKNKFRGYYPYDHNRVRLSLLPDVPGSDYINASLMHSYNQKKTYIASQAPNKKTVGDFWRMIWEHRCGRVIMLTGLMEVMKEKCYQYWPDKDDLQTDHHKVEVAVTDTRANYTIRHLKVTSKHNGEHRSVVQYHFTSWPDHGVPDTLALVHFIWMIRQTDTQTDGPLLVHCSAGIGRTGTYIAVDSLLDKAREEGLVGVLGYVSVMRGQRKNMIQTKEQYECVFHCLVEMTKFGNTSMDVENFTTSYSSRGMDSMVDRKTLRELTQMMLDEDRHENTSRNRMWVDGNQHFMVRVGPTLRHIRGYLMAVVPPPGLEKLLWKLVEEHNIHNIIVISQLQEDLFGDKGSRRKCGSLILTTTGQTNLDSDLTMMALELQETNSEDIQNVKVFKINDSPTLDSMSSCLLNHAHLQHLSGEITPNVIIHSESDRKYAVSLCIMGNILTGIMEDHRVDVIGHVRTFLKRCPDLTFTEQEVAKLFSFAKDFIQMTTASNIYANL